MGFDQLKLSKQLVRSASEAGYNHPTEIQSKTINRIIGGQDVIAIAPEGAGKTTAYILAALNKFNYAPDGVPKVLILVPEKEQVLTVIEQFDRLNKNKSILIVGLYVTPGTETQMDALADGADIVVATADRARAIYLKLGLNLNKMELFIVDDADQQIKKGLQLQVTELANSVGKCQHLVFTDVMHSRIEKLIEPFMRQPAIIEVNELQDTSVLTHPQLLYHVPNFGTKLNLLNLFLQDEELFTKTAVVVNSSTTAEAILKNMPRSLQQLTAYASQISVDDFKNDTTKRALLIVNERDDVADLSGLPFIIHFDLPAEKETFIERITNHNPQSEDETMALTFATDLELSMVKQIEQAIGSKIPVADLPEGLMIAKDAAVRKAKAKPDTEPTPTGGAAFHEKKASNAKTYNFSSSKKAKMNKKKNH
ncbi:MAG: DEAD/DEAH box helicase [Sphingobacteriaceae bacterium]|nr:MAG: DEAD/DEAH box helicase [Sphingobacteriaceae bacterium]